MRLISECQDFFLSFSLLFCIPSISFIMSMYHFYKHRRIIRICMNQKQRLAFYYQALKSPDGKRDFFFFFFLIAAGKEEGLKECCFMIVIHCMGFPDRASGKEPARQCRRHERRRFSPWVGKTPWRRARQPTPAFLPGESFGQTSLVGYSPQGRTKSDTTEATQHADLALSEMIAWVNADSFRPGSQLESGI